MSTEESSYGTAEEGIMEGCSNATLTSNNGASRPDSQICVTQPLEELEEKLSEPVVQEASSQPPSLSYSGDNEEEYLRATWQRLGVGHDGYLSLDELATVCHAIGMEKVANEVLEQLFSRLDVDGDGRISFEEFLHMFQNGGPSGNTSLVLDESQHQEVPGTPLSRMSSVSDDRRGGTGTESGVFSSVDPDNTGYASVETILELWESLSIGNGVSLLKEMGFPHRPHDRLSLADLSTALEEECRVTDDQAATTTATPVQLAVITYLHEIKFLRLSLDSARGERNKLRFDLNEANQRLALLAQELDEHNAHMEASSQHQIQELERQYRDQVRELQEAITRERDAARDQVSSVMRELQSQNSQLLQEDSKLKAKLSTLHADIKRLETENLELSEKLQEAQRQISQMEKQLVDLQELRKKVAEFESLSPREDEYRRLLDRLERVTAENQQLRDNNDELLSQMDSFPLRQNNARNSDKESLDGSCLGDYVDPPIGLLAPVKRRGSNSGSGDDSCEEESPRGVKVRRCSKGLNVHYVDVGSYDESFLDTSMSSLLKGGMPGLQNLDTSQPPSLDELSSKVRRKNSGQSDVSDGGFIKETGSPSMKSASQLLNRELKQVFRHVRASVKEEYKKDGSDCDSDRSYEGESKRMRRTTPEELEAELVKLREERDRLAKQLALQQEEFAHQLEKKEFEVEQALEECTGIKEQLEKTTTQLNLSFPDTNSSSLPISSTPVKSTHSGPTSLKDKGQLLTMALEELEMALRREEQERAQRISVEALLAKRSDGDSSTESIGGETTTTYPQTPSEPSSAAKLLLKGLGAPNGEGRVRVLEEQCRGLEGELARVRVEVLKMVEERDQLLQQKEDLEKRRDSEGGESMKQRIRNLVEKIKKKRQSHSPKTEENSLENASDCVKQEGDVSVSSQIKNSSSCADGKKDTVGEDDSSKQEDAIDEIELLEGEVSTLEKELAHEQDNLEKQKASLLEKNGKLEQDIEILRIELDKSEDYWTLKLQEEQDYYEEERRLYDDKFSALEKKIREYEELVLSGGGNGRDISEESDRLSTIDESAVWEKQVTDLEEEVSLLRKQIDELREERFNMECGWKACVDDERQKAAQECGKLQEQISSLTTQLHQAQHQVNSVFEELDKVRRESENRVRDLADQNRLNIQLSAPLVNGHDTELKGQSSPGSPEEKLFHQGSGSTGEETINGSLRSQLRQCQNRLRYLEAALRQHHAHAHHILSVTRQQHAAEVQNLESMITATQQMLGQHIAKYKDQLSKASKSDSLVRELYLENAQLMRALQITESRQKAAEETGRQLQIAALDHKMT